MTSTATRSRHRCQPVDAAATSTAWRRCSPALKTSP